MTKPINEEYNPLAWIADLTPLTQRFIMRWIETPWTLAELLEDEPDRDAIVRELQERNVLPLEVNPSI